MFRVIYKIIRLVKSICYMLPMIFLIIARIALHEVSDATQCTFTFIHLLSRSEKSIKQTLFAD